jgi:hypothetical protein
MALNGVYRFLYFYLMKKIPIKDVPSGLEDDVFDLEGVELGKYALQLPPPSDNKVSPASNDLNKELSRTEGTISKAHYSVDLSAIELQPLIDKMENQMSENVARLDAMESRFDGVDTKFVGVDTRFDGIDRRFDGIDTRFDGIEAKLNGILDALIKPIELPK